MNSVLNNLDLVEFVISNEDVGDDCLYQLTTFQIPTK